MTAAAWIACAVILLCVGQWFIIAALLDNGAADRGGTMTRYCLRVLAFVTWLLAAWAIARAAVDYSDGTRYVVGFTGIMLIWLGLCCWFGCRRPVVDDAEAMKRAARRAKGER